MNKTKLLSGITEESVLQACKVDLGPIDSAFLCRSVSVLNPPDPIILEQGATIADACRLLKSNSVGCVLIVNQNGQLAGVFSERDFMSKVFDAKIDIEHVEIGSVMTVDPFTVAPDSPIAYCLSLMSEGGFRHLPLVDQDNCPIGIVSVRDVVNYLTQHAVKGLLTV